MQRPLEQTRKTGELSEGIRAREKEEHLDISRSRKEGQIVSPGTRALQKEEP